MEAEASQQSLIARVPEFPPPPQYEVKKDSLTRFIAEEFSSSSQKQFIVSREFSGKTNFISQFCRFHPAITISYFVTPNPITQQLITFMYVISDQINHLLYGDTLPQDIAPEELKNLYAAHCTRLATHNKKSGLNAYFAIDGLEHCLDGEIGERIVDHPPLTYPYGPYLLLSCRPATLAKLPGTLKTNAVIQDNQEPALLFNQTDSRHFLSSLELSEEEIGIIHEKSGGLPGYEKIIRDGISARGKDWVTSRDLPDSIEQLVSLQIDSIYLDSDEDVIGAIESIAISPKPLDSQFLPYLSDRSSASSAQELGRLDIVRYDERADTFTIWPELARQAILRRIGDMRGKLSLDLLELVSDVSDQDELLITRLLEQAEDYEGLVERLETQHVIDTLNKTNNSYEIIKRVQVTADLARRNENLPDVLRWSREAACIRKLQVESVNSLEIVAMVSIGEYEEALKMFYSVRDTISKARLFGKNLLRDEGEQRADFLDGKRMN